MDLSIKASNSRRPNVHVSRRPARSIRLRHYGCAACDGRGLAGRKNLGHEIWSNHCQKKAYFRHFPPNLPRKLWPGFTIRVLAGGALGSGPSDSCCTLAETSHYEDGSGITPRQGLHPGFSSEGSSTIQVCSLGTN